MTPRRLPWLLLNYPLRSGDICSSLDQKTLRIDYYSLKCWLLFFLLHFCMSENQILLYYQERSAWNQIWLSTFNFYLDNTARKLKFLFISLVNMNKSIVICRFIFIYCRNQKRIYDLNKHLWWSALAKIVNSEKPLTILARNLHRRY